MDGSGDLLVKMPRHPEDLGKGKETQKETQFLKILRMKQSQEGDAGRKQIPRPSAGVRRAQNAGEEDAVLRDVMQFGQFKHLDDVRHRICH